MPMFLETFPWPEHLWRAKLEESLKERDDDFLYWAHAETHWFYHMMLKMGAGGIMNLSAIDIVIIHNIIKKEIERRGLRHPIWDSLDI